VIPGLGGDSDMGLYTSRSHRRRPRLAWKLAGGLLVGLSVVGLLTTFALCGALGLAR
jgi:hypothetical protein